MALFLVSSLWLLVFACPARAALDAEADRPYQFRVVLQVAEHRMLTGVFTDRLRRELRDSLQAALGDMAKVSVETRHPLLKEIEAKGLEAALDAVASTRAPLDDSKTHFLRVSYADGRYRILSRQVDGLTGTASPVVRREETTDRQYVARAAALLVGRDFGAVGTVQEVAADVSVVLKAGKLGPMKRWVQKGDVFAIVQIRSARGVLGAAPHAERDPWALLRAETAPNIDGVVRCQLLQRFKDSLAGGAGILGYRCIKLGTGRAPLRLRLVDEATRRPLDAQPVTIRRTSFDGDAEESFASDADGAITSAKEYEQVAFVQVESGGAVRARIPIPILDDRTVVVPVAANPGAEARGQFDLRRRQCLGQFYESLLVLDNLFKELNQLVEAKQHDKALQRAEAGLAELKEDLASREAELTSLVAAADELGQPNAGLREGEQRLQEMKTRRDELQRFAANLKVIKQAGEDRKVLLGLVEQARLFEGEAEFGKAIDIYRKIAEDPKADPMVRQSATTRQAELEKAWATRGNAEVQDFVFKQWPALQTAAELKGAIAKAQKAFATCRDAGDHLTPRMLLKTNLAHASRLAKRLKELQAKDREEARQEVEDITAVAGPLSKLTEEIGAFLRPAGEKK